MKSKLHSSDQIPAFGADGHIRVRHFLIASFLPLFLSIQSAHAIRLQVPLEASATVTNAANASRVLVSFGSFEFLEASTGGPECFPRAIPIAPSS